MSKYYVRGKPIDEDDWIIYADETLDEYEDECNIVTNKNGRILGVGRYAPIQKNKEE
jgi:hypothetical protein